MVDAVAIIREMDLISMYGEINSGENQIHIAGKLNMTQKDINEFQLS